MVFTSRRGLDARTDTPNTPCALHLLPTPADYTNSRAPPGHTSGMELGHRYRAAKLRQTSRQVKPKIRRYADVRHHTPGFPRHRHRLVSHQGVAPRRMMDHHMDGGGVPNVTGLARPHTRRLPDYLPRHGRPAPDPPPRPPGNPRPAGHRHRARAPRGPGRSGQSWRLAPPYCGRRRLRENPHPHPSRRPPDQPGRAGQSHSAAHLHPACGPGNARPLSASGRLGLTTGPWRHLSRGRSSPASSLRPGRRAAGRLHDSRSGRRVRPYGAGPSGPRLRRFGPAPPLGPRAFPAPKRCCRCTRAISIPIGPSPI